MRWRSGTTTETRAVSLSDEVAKVQEQLWVVRAQDRDPEAFRSLVDAYERRLLYFILRLVGDVDTALDLAQDVWLTVFVRLPALRAPGAFRAWLYQIAHDKAATAVHRRRREADVHEAYAADQGTEEEADEAAYESVELVHRMLERLPLPYREVLTLRFLEDMGLEEIGEVLRCPVGTVKSRLHYAKRALRRRAEESMYEG